MTKARQTIPVANSRASCVSRKLRALYTVKRRRRPPPPSPATFPPLLQRFRSAIKYVGLKRKTKIHISLRSAPPTGGGITREGGGQRVESGIVGRTLQTFAGINGHLHVRVLFRWLSADSFRCAPRAQKLHPPPPHCLQRYICTRYPGIRHYRWPGVRWYRTYIRRRTCSGYLKF